MDKRSRSTTSVMVLFDLDRTLTVSRRRESAHVLSVLKRLRTHVSIGLVSSSDLQKQKEQLGDNVLDTFDYSAARTATWPTKDGTRSPGRRFANWTLAYIARLNIPVKTGTFTELPTGTYNVSLCGRNSTQDERTAFCELDWRLHLRRHICESSAI
jgi:phosphomannomutase